MDASVTIPKLSVDSDYDVWRKKINMWHVVSPHNKTHGILVVLKALEGNNKAEKAVESLTEEEIHNEDGFNIVLKKLDEIFKTEKHICMKWKTVKKLGEGAFGEVFLVEEISTGKKRAKKVIKIKSEKIVEEATYLKECDHEHIIRYIEHDEVEIDGIRHFNIIMEYAEKGALSQNMRYFKKEHEVAEITYQMLLALEHIHNRKPPIIHRDVKLENIFLMNDLKAKLGDFGICRLHGKTSEAKTKEQGTFQTMAPEVWTKKYNCKADIWSLGCVASALMNGDYLLTEEQIKKFKKDKAKEHPVFFSFVNQTRKDFKDRPSASDLLQHEWFKVCAKKLIEKIEKLLEQKDYKDALKLLDCKLLNNPQFSLKFNIEPHHNRKHGDDSNIKEVEDQPRPKTGADDERPMQDSLEKIKNLLDHKCYKDAFNLLDNNPQFSLKLRIAIELHQKRKHGDDQTRLESVERNKSEQHKPKNEIFRYKMEYIAKWFESDALAEKGAKRFNKRYIDGSKEIPDSAKNLFQFGIEIQFGDDDKNLEDNSWCMLSIISYLFAILKSTENTYDANKQEVMERIANCFEFITRVIVEYIKTKGTNLCHLVDTIDKVFLYTYSKVETLKDTEDNWIWCRANMAEIHDELAGAYFNLGNFSKAKEGYERAKDLYESMDFENNQGLITELEDKIEKCNKPGTIVNSACDISNVSD